MAQGIVAPQDFVNNASLPQLKSDKIKKGDGIFVLNQKELDNLNLSNSERELIKPYCISVITNKRVYLLKSKN